MKKKGLYIALGVFIIAGIVVGSMMLTGSGPTEEGVKKADEIMEDLDDLWSDSSSTAMPDWEEEEVDEEVELEGDSIVLDSVETEAEH